MVKVSSKNFTIQQDLCSERHEIYVKRLGLSSRHIMTVSDISYLEELRELLEKYFEKNEIVNTVCKKE